MTRLTEIAATIGDPCSIGPQVAAQSLLKFSTRKIKIHIFGSKAALFSYLSQKDREKLESHPNFEFHDLQNDENYVAGKPSRESGYRALLDLKAATSFVLDHHLKALVTGPVDKYYCSLSDPEFKGQTEYLQKISSSPGVTMVLAGPSLKVALVTTHLALRDVADRVSVDKIIQTSLRFESYLRKFKARPRLAVCALNPHASDNGLFGNEEEKIISPAVRLLQKEGLLVDGPFPADGLFYRSAQFDGIVCMYHDQGLIPLKMKDFYEAVNISLGLPFLRVSVDHGTAFDLVGSKDVSSLSYERALEQAMAWAERSSQEN